MSKVIKYEDDEAAQLKTVNVWVSSRGNWFKAESSARYNGCTHRKCEDCDNYCEKGWLRCSTCRDKIYLENYNKLEFKTWDGATTIYSKAFQRYFDSIEEMADHIDYYELRSFDPMLVICEPNHVKQIDFDEMFSDELPEDTALEEIKEAQKLSSMFDEINEYINKEKIIISWSPGKFRTKVNINE